MSEEIEIYHHSQTPTFLGSAIKALVRSRGVALGASAVDAMITFSAAALMPIVKATVSGAPHR